MSRQITLPPLFISTYESHSLQIRLTGPFVLNFEWIRCRYFRYFVAVRDDWLSVASPPCWSRPATPFSCDTVVLDSASDAANLTLVSKISHRVLTFRYGVSLSPLRLFPPCFVYRTFTLCLSGTVAESECVRTVTAGPPATHSRCPQHRHVLQNSLLARNLIAPTTHSAHSFLDKQD